MPRAPGGRRRGIGPADVAVALACALAVLLAGPGPGGSAGGREGAAPGSAAEPAALPAPPRLAAPLVDPDGVQRRLGAADAPAVALTFDDGPDPRWTPAVLDLLRTHRVPATFCLVGRHAAEHPELVRRIAAEGHALCNHSWAHDAAMHLRSAAAVRADLERTNQAIAAAAGAPPRYYRAPAGNWAPVAVAAARQLDLRLLGWSVDPLDWRRPPAPEITRRVLAGAEPGSIVLLHDGYGHRGTTVAALETLIQELAARRLRFTTP